MKVLGIETATAVCAAALLLDGRTLREESISSPHAHSEMLLTLVDRCLANSGVSLSALDLVAVSIGPGSFTGLRIGLSTAKGLAAAADVPLVAVPTLHAMAGSALASGLFHEREEAFLFPMIDARRDEVYAALYRGAPGAELSELIPPRAARVSECTALLPGEGSVFFLGDGAEKFLRSVERERDKRLILLPEGAREPRASGVASLGERMHNAGVRTDIAGVEPLYVKDFYTLIRTQHPEVTA